MKLLFLAFASFAISLNAQNNFKQIVDKIDWHGTEADIVYSLYNFIEKSKHEEWDIEKTESNFRFKNIAISGIPLVNSYIRVKKDNKNIYRINFIFLNNETDLSIYPKIENYLTNNYGESDNLTWVFDDYIMKALFIDMSNVQTEEIEKYTYAISLEPIRTFYVNRESAIVESNNSRSAVPQIEYFKVDNDSNVFIKEKDKELTKKICDKIITTPKGDVIVFDGGMFCYRKENNDIVYMKQGLAVTYPIIR